MIPLAIRFLIVFLAGTCLGSFVNWAIYTLAWNPRPISPWGDAPAIAPPRNWFDRVPILGWFRLRREEPLHGRRFWLRPMLLELGMGAALAGLYWWEVVKMGLIRDQLQGVAITPPVWPLHWEFVSHTILLCLMAAASFIDIDEKTIPDEITFPGTLLGLLLATLVPTSLLPFVAEHPAFPAMAASDVLGKTPDGNGLWLESLTAVSPHGWPTNWGHPRAWQGLAIGLGCFWLWCFALAPRIWRGRRGPVFATALILRRVGRTFSQAPMPILLGIGSIWIFCTWGFSYWAWKGLLNSLIGLAASGGLVWAVRLIGTAALRREAMGFGDVTLMMMVGTFLGWQACVIAFFLAPFAGLLVGIAQFVLRRDDVIPYGPFLCLGSAAVVVFWGPIWMWAQPIFEMGTLVPAVLVICLAMLGILLGIWQAVKTALFGPAD